MIILLEPNQSVEIRFAHSRDEHGEPQTADGAITVSYDDEAKRIRVTASSPDSTGRGGVIYSDKYAAHDTAEEPSEKDIEIFRRVASITADNLFRPVGTVEMESDFFDDLGADSLDQVELLMAFEEEFGLEIPDEDADGIETVGDVVAYLRKKL